MRRVQFQDDERPVEASGNARGGQEIVGELADPTRHRESHWLWLGARESDGRAVVRIDRRKRQVSRVLWALFREAPTVERVVKRTCEHEGCVNPWHATLMRRGSWQVDPQARADEARTILRMLDEANLSGMGRGMVLEAAGATPTVASMRRILSEFGH
jgi:hypothetical protein